MNKLLSYTSVLLVFFLLGSYPPPSDADKDKVLMGVIMESLNSGHYTALEIDDDFSAKAYELYVKRLDYNKRFLLDEDVKRFDNYRTALDEQIQAQNYEFFDLSLEIIEKRVKEVEGFYEDILSKPFDFTKEENVEFDTDKLSYVKSKDALKERWRKLLKYNTMTRLADLMDDQEKAKENEEEDYEEKSFEELEKEAREKVMKSQKNYFRRLSQLERSDRLTTYINAITNTYDPHTGYFPPKDKEDFDIQMSGRLEGIGATLSEKDGYIEVQRIVPGSACWKQGELEVGDLIVAVGQGEEDPVDVVEMRLDNAVKLIRGKKGTEVRLTVKKVDGAKTIIPIIRDVVILEETYAKSVLIKDKKKSIGYIKLPKFYADFSKKGGRNCAEDVRLEIEKLQKENVKGLILDLRNNGGGSLKDAVDMAGLFIERGPIVQVKSRYGAPYVFSDKDPKVQYRGPLIIMVNSFSASASEILAAAMQDYNRAIIIGSETTYGKGTVQRFYDLDRFLKGRDYDHIKPLGSIKLTTQKFYRIDGGATQLRGVIPDIVLPDNYRYIDVGEKEHDHPMQWDEIKPLEFDSWNISEGQRARLKKEVETRVSASSTFDLINEYAGKLKTDRDDTKSTLNLETYRTEAKERKDESDEYTDKLEGAAPDISVEFLKSDLPSIKADSSKQVRMDDWKEDLEKDVYLYEAINVFKTMK